MRGKLVFLCVVVLLVSSCGQALVKPTQPNNLPDLVTDHIITPYDHYYPGSTVELSVKLSVVPKEIWFGEFDNLVKSTNSPVDGIWKGSFKLKNSSGESTIISVVLSLANGEKKSLYKEVSLVREPQINIEQSRSSKTGDKLIVWADVELAKVEYIDPNGKTTSFTKKDKEFTLEQKLPEPGKPAGIIKTTDLLGTVAEKQIKASGIDEPRLYYIDSEPRFDELERVGTQEVKESSLDLSYNKTAFLIKIKQPFCKDLNDLESIKRSDTPLDYVGYIRLRALSKDRKWAIVTTTNGSSIKDDYIENGHILIDVNFIIYLCIQYLNWRTKTSGNYGTKMVQRLQDKFRFVVFSCVYGQ